MAKCPKCGHAIAVSECEGDGVTAFCPECDWEVLQRHVEIGSPQDDWFDEAYRRIDKIYQRITIIVGRAMPDYPEEE